MDTVVLLLSGGIGSATSAYRRRREARLRPLFLDYGQPAAAAQLDAASAVATALQVQLEVIELPHMATVATVAERRLGRSGTRTTAPGDLARIDAEFGGPGFATLLSVGVEYAAAVGAEVLVSGRMGIPAGSGAVGLAPVAHERMIDPRELHHAFAMMLETALPKVRPIRLETPVIGLEPAEVVKLAQRLGVPLQRTWSCQETSPPCGTCAGCRTRAAALAGAGLPDPLLQPVRA